MYSTTGTEEYGTQKRTVTTTGGHSKPMRFENRYQEKKGSQQPAQDSTRHERHDTCERLSRLPATKLFISISMLVL